MLTPITLNTKKNRKFLKKCQYCNSNVSNYIYKRHLKICHLSPSVATGIIAYFNLCLTDLTFMMKKEYNIYAKKSKLPNAQIILSLIPNSSYWHTIFPFLILSYFENNILLDIEKYDLLIRIATLNSMGTDYNYFKTSKDNFISENNLDLYDNYQLLIFSIIQRAIKDYLSVKNYDENGDLIDKHDALTFLQEFYPKYVKYV